VTTTSQSWISEGRTSGARERLARELYDIDDLELSLEGARRLAYEEPIGRPSAYALAVMMNFLTPGSHALTSFSDAIDRLMGSSLVPGGTILALGQDALVEPVQCQTPPVIRGPGQRTPAVSRWIPAHEHAGLLR
jgi:hypothetical protein